LQRDSRFRQEVFAKLFLHPELSTIRNAERLNDPSVRPVVLDTLTRILGSWKEEIPPSLAGPNLGKKLCDEVFRFTLLERFLADGQVTRVCVQVGGTVVLDTHRGREFASVQYPSYEQLNRDLRAWLLPSFPELPAVLDHFSRTLPNGMQCNTTMSTTTRGAPWAVIDKTRSQQPSMKDLIQQQMLTDGMAQFLQRSLQLGKSVVVAGTYPQSGLVWRAIHSLFQEQNRIVTLGSLPIKHTHTWTLHAPGTEELGLVKNTSEDQPSVLENTPQKSVPDLVQDALAFVPDHVALELSEAWEHQWLQHWLATGTAGTVLLSKLETWSALTRWLKQVHRQPENTLGLHVVVFCNRNRDGKVRVQSVSEISPQTHTDDLQINPIYQYVVSDNQDEQHGFYPTGYLPSFVDEMIDLGLIDHGTFVL
jgi:Flp pilus assembly CpaF family ATPase